jgi:hypothetical protein
MTHIWLTAAAASRVSLWRVKRTIDANVKRKSRG